MNLAKVVFMILNSLFMILGVVILAMGIYLQISEASNYMNVLPDIKFTTPVSLIVAAGIITMVVAILGFCAAVMESRCLIIVYIVCVSAIFCVEISAGVIGFLRKDELQKDFAGKLILSLGKTQKSWDYIQVTHKCCGVKNYTDWQGEVSTPSNLPSSCCITECRTSTDAYKTPCMDKLEDWINENLYLLGVTAVVIGILQIALLLMASIFLCCMRR